MLSNRYNMLYYDDNTKGDFMGFGEFIEELRLNSNKTLRECCLDFGYDVGNHSKLERGLRKPPEDKEILEKLAKNLGLKKSSEDWFKFFDLAFTSRKDYKFTKLTNEELLQKLPVLFRAIDRPNFSKEELEELLEVVRKHHESD